MAFFFGKLYILYAICASGSIQSVQTGAVFIKNRRCVYSP